MSTKKRLKETTVTRYNEHGEMVSHQHIEETATDGEPSYMKLYLQDIAYLHNVNGADPVINELLKLVTYDGLIVLNAAIKAVIAEKVGMKVSSLGNLLTKLVNHAVLIWKGRGLYEINPYIFGKGKWKDIKARRNAIGYQVTFDEEGNRHVTFDLGQEYVKGTGRKKSQKQGTHGNQKTKAQREEEQQEFEEFQEAMKKAV